MSKASIAKYSLPAAVAAALSLPTEVDAAFDMFIKLGDIKGEAENKAFPGWIDVLSWSWGMTQSSRPREGPCVQDLSFTKIMDSSTPGIAKLMNDDSILPRAMLVVLRDTEEPVEYLQYEMTDVLVTSYGVSGTDADRTITENVALNFEKLRAAYVPIEPTGEPGTPAEYEVDPGECKGKE